MTHNSRLHIPVLTNPPQQSGAALITGLIFLVVLTMIGVTTARMSSLEERMSGNLRDRTVALQAAELALRDAERDIMNTVPAAARNISGITGFVADCGASTTAAPETPATTVDDGLCYNGPLGYATAIWTTANMTTAPSVRYGRFTNAPDIAGLSDPPRYLIEGIRKKLSDYGTFTFFYRITVRAQGANPNTVVWLQEILHP